MAKAIVLRSDASFVASDLPVQANLPRDQGFRGRVHGQARKTSIARSRPLSNLALDDLGLFSNPRSLRLLTSQWNRNSRLISRWNTNHISKGNTQNRADAETHYQTRKVDPAKPPAFSAWDNDC